jgi:fructose-specific phosphotransferase system IIC component
MQDVVKDLGEEFQPQPGLRANWDFRWVASVGAILGAFGGTVIGALSGVVFLFMNEYSEVPYSRWQEIGIIGIAGLVGALVVGSIMALVHLAFAGFFMLCGRFIAVVARLFKGTFWF